MIDKLLFLSLFEVQVFNCHMKTVTFFKSVIDTDMFIMIYTYLRYWQPSQFKLYTP